MAGRRSRCPPPQRDVGKGAATVADLGATDEGWQPVRSPGAGTPADILSTSGTTGSPKGVLLTHDMLLGTAYGALTRAPSRTVAR